MATTMDSLIGLMSMTYTDYTEKTVTAYHKGDLIRYLNNPRINQTTAAEIFKSALKYEDTEVLLKAFELIEQHGYNIKFFLTHSHNPLVSQNLFLKIFHDGDNQLFDIACILVNESGYKFNCYVACNIIGTLMEKDDKEKIEIFFSYQWDLSDYFPMYDFCKKFIADFPGYWALSIKYPWITKNYQADEWKSYQKNPGSIVNYWAEREKNLVNEYYYDNFLGMIFTIIQHENQNCL